MDVKAKRKYGKKHKKRSMDKKAQSVPRISRLSKLEGIEKLFLSPLTQQILNCRIGVNITAQEPWIFVPKEKILENIELHDNSSEFLPLKQEIESYPDDKILIGCYGHDQNEPEEFMVCITLDTVQITLNALQAQEAARHQKIIDSITKVCGIWTSLGSEIEVDENMRLTLRKPFQVYLSSEAACFFVRSKFTFRFVADSPDGYVESSPARQTFKNVLRRRVHSYAQCSALKVCAKTQTMIEPIMNKATMSSHTTKAKKLLRGALENFIANVDYKYILDLLQTNYYMDLCKRDYDFMNAQHMQIFQFPLCILSFQDIFSCRGKRVSCVSWNAMKSGLIAASYVKQTPTMIVNKEKSYKSQETVFGNHLVLVWSYTDILKPHLYLHCLREVTVVSFCSYNANIVVGGCDNGQIVVWDISGRIELSGITKILTRQQQENHSLLQHYMHWMRKPPAVKHVYPIIISKIEESHSSPVSCIEWLPPDQLITKNGKFEKRKSNNTQMEFISCSTENGCIAVWDIGVPKDAVFEMKKKRIIRLNKLPEALTKYESSLKTLQKSFIPVFRIMVSNPETRRPLAISKLLEKQGGLNYKALNPETEENVLKRTHFEHILDKSEAISEQELICTTTFGEIYSIQWDGFDYDQGCLINSNVANVCNTKTYHDGPIVICMESPIIKDLILTIGGKVFAIWNLNSLEVPIFWRKTAHRYVTGCWLTTQPFQIGLVRYDTFKEIWDMMEDSKKPLKTYKGKGRAIDGLFNDFKRMHAKKGTFAATNVAGEINIYSVLQSSKDINNEEIDAVINYLGDLEKTKEKLFHWIEQIKNHFTIIESKIEDEEVAAAAAVKTNKETTVDESAKRNSKKPAVLVEEKNKWQAKEEAFMREVLLANKNMKMDQLNQNSDLIKQAEELRKKHSHKFAEQIKNKDKNLHAWRMLLIPEQKFNKKMKITVTFSKDMSQYMKQSYLQNYNDIEEESLDYIKAHVYHYFYNWADLHKRAKSSWIRRTRTFKFGTSISERTEIVPITVYAIS